MSFEIPSVMNSGTLKDHVRTEQQVKVNVGKKQTAEKIKEQDSHKEIRSASTTLEQAANIFNKRLKLRVDEDIDRVVVKVIDTTNNKVIKEIPPVEVQRMLLRIKETIGILFDEKI
ncbi:MAG: flagellar protein FlaG [Spirochaetia bacterium]